MSTFRDDGALALDWVASYLEGVRDLPVLSQVEPGAIRAGLPSSPPDDPEPFSAVLDDLDTVLLPGLTHWQSPRFFAYFATTGAEPGVLAELLIAGLNQVGILWRTSPALQELEELTVDWLRQLVGLPGGVRRPHRGHGLDRGARRRDRRALAPARSSRSRLLRARALRGRESGQAPRARAAQGADRRRVPHATRSDRRRGRVCGHRDDRDDGDDLRRSRPGDSASAAPHAGTWLHVDAAYAGSAAILPELAHHFAGWELADSIGVNPHKWLGVPMDCSVLWTRRQEDFRNAFSLVPEFLRSPDDALNLSEVSIPLGRRFRALKLWTVLRCYGRIGLQQRLREHLRLAQLFEGWVRDEPGWEVTAPRHFSLVCFRREGSDEDNERLLERVNGSGEVFLSHTRFADRYQLRLAVGSFRTSEDDVRLAWDVLRREAAAL